MIKKNILNIIGCIIGVFIIIVGIDFLCNPAMSFRTLTADDATFGADFYTLQYDATRIVANNTAVAANNLRELSNKIADYFGYIFIFAGALVILHFAKTMDFKQTNSGLKVVEDDSLKDVGAEPEASVTNYSE